MNKKYIGIIVILTCSFLFISSNTYSQSNKELYDLQDKCGKRSEERFKKEYGNGITNDKNGQMLSVYVNHYNMKLNKCFILLTHRTYPKDKKYFLIMKSLLDINENKDYGSFTKADKNIKPNECVVLDKYCNSEEEWDLLVKPYMEE